jgi:maltose/moltooligosaccharide transporter
MYTFLRVKEMPPKEYAEFHGIDLQAEAGKKADAGLVKLLTKAPATFWTVGLVQFFCWAAFLYMWTYTNGAIADNVWHTFDTSSEAYQTAGNWVGVLFAVQAVGSLVWAAVLPRFKSIKLSYVVSLLIGAAGFASVFFIHNQYLLFVSYFLIGFAWAAMLALPFTLLTNALEGSPYMGSYLGLFNCTICLPQIVAAATGGAVLSLVGGGQPAMMLMAGAFLVLGALSVRFIKTK